MKHVSIVGCGGSLPSTIPPGEVWNCNYAPPPKVLKRLTRTFQIHPLGVLDKKEREWLKETKAPIVYVTPSTHRPRERLLPPLPWGPFCSSFDYMMAVAIKEHFGAITLVGVHLQKGSRRERLAEHVSLAYWIGKAHGLGIVVEWPSCHILMAPFRYGINYWKEKAWVERLVASFPTPPSNRSRRGHRRAAQPAAQLGAGGARNDSAWSDTDTIRWR